MLSTARLPGLDGTIGGVVRFGRCLDNAGGLPISIELQAADQLHHILLAKPNAANRIDWSRRAMDGGHIDAEKGVPEQVHLRSTWQARFKHHLICDGNGTRSMC